MATFQDLSIGGAIETTYKTPVTVTRWWEIDPTAEALGWTKTVKVGKGARVAGRLARSARRVVPFAQGDGSFGLEAVSKGLGILYQAALGAGVSTLVSGSTYQQLFTLGDTPPSLTLQKGLPEVGGTVDPYTYAGCMVSSFELDFTNVDIVMLKFTWDIADLATATGYATPSYSTSPTLWNFSQGAIYTGTFTAPTTTALASGATQMADIRGGSLVLNNNLSFRPNLGASRKVKPTVGLRDLTGKLTAEYDVTTYRDAVLNETPMCLVLTYTGAALSTGNEILQVVIPEVKFDSPLPVANGTDLITTDFSWSAYDNLTNTGPNAFQIVTRTADTAL